MRILLWIVYIIFFIPVTMFCLLMSYIDDLRTERTELSKNDAGWRSAILHSHCGR